MGSSSTTQNTQNVAFVSSNNIDNTNKAVNTAHSISAASSKTNASNLPNVDSLSDAVIYSFFARDGLTVADGNVDYKSQKILAENRKESMATKHQDYKNREVPRRTVPVEDTTSNALVSQCDGLGYDWSDQAKEGPTSFALMAYTSSSSSSSDTKLRQKFEKTKKEKDDLKLTLEKFQDSSKNINRLLDSQRSDKSKTGLGYDSQVLENQINDKNNTGEGYHAIPPPYTGNFMPPKPDLVFVDEHVVSESDTSLHDIRKNKVKTSETTIRNVSAPIIKDCVSDSEDEDEI
uniref:Uncharacterized protein n=1 Tax=Tanacetum cinerariifolium TaxID=118510 RepID=A0A6L2N7L8_TANCI|nr:hypothetical protein [Tanacetum cinerariifolium]